MPLKTAKFLRRAIAMRATTARLMDKLIDRILGPTARAGRLVADRDALIIGLRARPPSPAMPLAAH